MQARAKGNVIAFVRHRRPRVYTSQEQVIERVREELFKCGLPWKVIAVGTNRSPATIHRLASGHTKWPKPDTLFPVMLFLGLGFEIVEAGKGGKAGKGKGGK